MDRFEFCCFVVAIVAMMGVFFCGGIIAGSTGVIEEAYQRGHMVECLGKSGYYWECE